MSLSIYFDTTVSESIKDEFKDYDTADVGGGYEVRPGDLLQLRSKTSGSSKIFMVRQRAFSFVPDENGDGTIYLILRELLDEELFIHLKGDRS